MKEREKERETDRQTDRQTDRERQRETERTGGGMRGSMIVNLTRTNQTGKSFGEI